MHSTPRIPNFNSASVRFHPGRVGHLMRYEFYKRKNVDIRVILAHIQLNRNPERADMRQLEDYMDLDTLLELEPRKIGEFCVGVLDADILTEELEEYGPFAPLRKYFCEFLGIGESTLTGWLKAARVPQPAIVAYVLLVGMTKLQAEVKRLRQDAHELKIVQEGKTFQVVRFEDDETGVSIGQVVARDIPNAKTARVLAGSVKAFRMLQSTRYVIGEMLERTENAQYIDHLQDLDTRIIKETLAAFEPDKWRELFGPVHLDGGIDELLGELDNRREARASVEPDTTLEGGSTSGGQDDAGASRKRD